MLKLNPTANVSFLRQRLRYSRETKELDIMRWYKAVPVKLFKYWGERTLKTVPIRSLTPTKHMPFDQALNSQLLLRGPHQ